MSFDAVNHPRHYTSHPSGIECIQESPCHADVLLHLANPEVVQ